MRTLSELVAFASGRRGVAVGTVVEKCSVGLNFKALKFHGVLPKGESLCRFSFRGLGPSHNTEEAFSWKQIS